MNKGVGHIFQAGLGSNSPIVHVGGLLLSDDVQKPREQDWIIKPKESLKTCSQADRSFPQTD